MSSATSACRACGAEMIWTFTESGKRMPLDAEPSSEGTFVTEMRGKDLYAVYVKRGSDPDARTSHFATCPSAADFRRPNG